MAQVTVCFFGICTHIEAEFFDPHPTEWQRRVVLPRADAGIIDSHPKLHDKGIVPHVASLQLLTPSIALGQPIPSTSWCLSTGSDPEMSVWTLDGALLRIVNARGQSAPQPARCIPSLTSVCEPLPLPSLGRAAYAGDRDLTWAAFDFPAVSPAGQFFGQGAAVGVVVVDVDGDKASLEIRPIDAAAGPPIVLTLNDGARITVANIPALSGDDSLNDFLLHFLVTDTIPDAGPPLAISPLTCGLLPLINLPINIDGLTGPGCSNSTYP
jgi:hypothetical protein